MLIFSKKSADNLVLINLLNQVWKLKYSYIDIYPRLSRSIKDEYTNVLLIALATASLKHADMVARAFVLLEEDPSSDRQTNEATPNLIEFFREQMGKEQLAMKLDQQIAGLVKDENLQFEFSCMAEEECTLARMVKIIISNLNRGVDKNEFVLSLAPAVG
jgi:hypothetical protein